MKKKQPAVIAAALALATLIGGTTGASPASAALSVSKEACTVVVWRPPSTFGRVVVATAAVTCTQAREVYLQQSVRESDGGRRSNLIDIEGSGWFTVSAGQTRSVTIYVTCRNTELGREEYYQATRLVVAGYDANRYSPWAAGFTRSASC